MSPIETPTKPGPPPQDLPKHKATVPWKLVDSPAPGTRAADVSSLEKNSMMKVSRIVVIDDQPDVAVILYDIDIATPGKS